MLFVVPNSHHIGAGALGVLEGVEHGCIYNWYEEIEPVIPRVYHKYLKRYNPFGSESIILSAEDGSADGKFVITINEELEEGNSYVYKFTDKYPQPGEDVSDWDAWDGSTEFEAESGTSICIVEADAEGLAVKAGMVVVIDEDEDEEEPEPEPEPELVLLSLNAEEGTEEGFTKITVLENTLGEGNKYVYMATYALPTYHQDLSAWTDWNGTDEIEAETGTTLCIAEVTAEGLAEKAGTVDAVAKEPPQLGTLTVISDGSETPGYTNITIQEEKLEETNQYFYKFDEPLPELNQNVSDWTSWDGVSDIQADNGHTITVVEATAEGLAVAAGEANISATLRTLTVTTEPGTQVGYVKVTVETEKVDPNDGYYIQTGETEDSGSITTWNGTDEIAIAKDGNYVVVSEINTTSYQFVAKGSTNATVAKIKDLTVTAGEGTAVGTVALTVTETAGEGHSFGYVLYTDSEPAHGYGTVVEATAFTSGADVNSGDSTNVAVFELTAENKVYGYGTAACTPKEEEEIEPQIGSLTVTCAEGEQVGYTKITVEPTLTVGNKYCTKENGELPSTWHQDMTSGDWTEWNGTDEVQATDATPITVVETTAEGLAEKAGTGTTDVKPEPEPELGTLTLSAQGGTLMYSTKITVTEPKVEETDQYFYKAQEEKPVYGESVLEWTSWDGTSDIVVDNGTTLCIVEATQEGTAVAAGTVVADCRQNLSVISEPSDTTVGNTKITISPEKTGDNVYFWKLAEQEEQVTLPNKGESVSDWTSWDGSEELAISNGSVAMFAEASAEGIVYAAGQAVIQSKVQ